MNFRDLHYGTTPLLLPNAWDIASAVTVAAAGFPAIGTTSFGIGAAAGHPDGARASKDGTAALVRALSGLPAYVSADIEDGYADDPDEVATYVAGLGAAGINIEDSTGEALISPAAHAAKIAAIKHRAPEVFVNARIDSYWLKQEATIDAVLQRAKTYVDAGADGIFVPGVSDPADLRALGAAIPIPVNVLVVPDLTLHDLGGLGISRISTGSLPYRAALDSALAVATAVRDGIRPPGATPYPEVQQTLVNFERRRQS